MRCMSLKRGYARWKRPYEERILVTGGAGYIGSHTCKALAAAGYTVVVFDNLSTGFRKLAKWGEFIQGDILDEEKLRACLHKHKPEGIIHFAAFSQVGESACNPGKYIRNNVGGTLGILQAMRDTGVRNIVVSSTAAVYGIPEHCPITEAMPARPVNPYGETKLFVEWMLADFARPYGLSWTALHYFNAAGADPEGECGECHLPETHLIPRALMAVTGELKDFRVMGNDYPTPDGASYETTSMFRLWLPRMCLRWNACTPKSQTREFHSISARGRNFT